MLLEDSALIASRIDFKYTFILNGGGQLCVLWMSGQVNNILLL